MVVQSLARSGEFEAALELLEDLRFEAGGAQAVADLAADPAVQRRALREFYRLFAQHWRKLDSSEAEAWLDEILPAIEAEAARPMLARFGHVELRSTAWKA